MFGEHPGALLPFGGHKGYALGVVAELLAGVLSGGGTIQPDNPRGGVATNNLFAVLLNPALDLGLDWQSAEVEAFVRYLHDTPRGRRPRAVPRRIRGRQPGAGWRHAGHQPGHLAQP